MILEVFKKDIKALYNQLKASAKKRGIEFNLKPSDLHAITFPVTCPILGIPLRFNRLRADDFSYSIDRIDSNKGYQADNIIVISNRANILKRDATLKELNALCEFYNELEELKQLTS